MDKPQRYQRLRAKGWRMPPNSVYVGRPTPYGNPFKVGDEFPNGNRVESPRDAVEFYRAFAAIPDLADLRGKNLLCWCREDQPCHADLLLEWANGEGNAS